MGLLEMIALYTAMGLILTLSLGVALGVIYEDARFDRYCRDGRISLRDEARYHEVGGIMGGFTFCDPIGPPGTYPRHITDIAYRGM